MKRKYIPSRNSKTRLSLYTGKKNMVKSTGRSPVANFTLAYRCSPVESPVLFNVALTVEPTLNHPKMISCGNTRDCSCQFFCFPNKSFPNYILVFESKALPISLWI